MNIDRIKNTSKLDTATTRPDIRRDLHVFTSYAQQREMKRGHRDNAISKPDARRLAKLLSDPEAEAEVKEDGYSPWLYYVDWFTHQLGLAQPCRDGQWLRLIGVDSPNQEPQIHHGRRFHPGHCRRERQSKRCQGDAPARPGA